MPTSDRRSGASSEGILLGVLLTANILFFAAWPWLRGLPLSADSTDPPVRTLGTGRTAARTLKPESVLRNPGYLSSFFDAVRGERGILFLGTSETLHYFNLGAQLNARFPENPPMAVLAKAGTSPVHSTLLFASSRREGIEVPPLVILINLVYFTESHDLINDGWMSSLMRSEVFVQLDHRQVMERVSPEVRSLYGEHSRLRRFLSPFYAQEYLGNLLYLSAHQGARQVFPREVLPIRRYEFDGVVPEYDRARGVHAGYVASDQRAKARWEVKTVEQCLNLKGLASTVSLLEKQEAPVLLLVLPANRRFYAANGLDMTRYDRRYRALRDSIGRFQRPGRIFLIDLYDSPWLDYGFSDRMHQDAYGFHQIARHLGTDGTYERFNRTVRSYYSREPESIGVAAPGS